ncbi:FecR family protein [Massilia agri]|uniref:FecR family protein n=1 Tax=Massilia agri TaxID=1886785 RepID=A0ABT2AM24_9BURK|nr:FecR family protein [Massilia agri]MCS0597294.1 FecR family protein [Massilia agri]
MLHKYALVALLLCATSGTAMAAEAGRVVFVAGKADIGRHAASQDAVVEEGDELSTGADGYIYVKTVDNGFLILRPNSTARIVAYAIDKQDPSKTQVKLELTQGVARTISGQGVKQARQNFRFNTPVAAIGVRGTDFTVYTDQQTTRVTVLSGGVVMSGFGTGCSAAGTGPCEGRDARELFAGQSGLLLQVERGGQVPQLIQNPALSPDQAQKPRSDEPAVTPGAPSAPIAQVNLDPRRSDSLNNARPAPAPVPPPVDTRPPVVIVEPEPPVEQSEPEIFWGRWQAVASKPAKPGRIEDPEMDIPFYNSQYAIARIKNSSLVMPKEGTAAFRLEGGEAVMTTGSYERVASVESGQLNMDFSKRTFVTSLVVAAGSQRANVVGSGVVSDNGMLYEDSRSDTMIRGFLGGPKAEQAGYIFKNSANPGVTVSGATLWGR